MKRLLIILLALALLPSCAPLTGGSGEDVDTTAWLNMNTDYTSPTSLPDGGGKRARVILLLGQSNATGCSLNDYLQKNVSADDFTRYSSGFDSVLINFCLDDHKYSSHGEFVPVDLTVSAEGCFGPELGMAEKLALAYPDETVFILKYTMSGYSLHHHWLCGGARGSIYEAALVFIETQMSALVSHGYDARIQAICWMQGESDTTDFKASKYLENQTAFAAYLREDLAAYAREDGILFIDAGISNSPYCEPAYPEINEAKLAFSLLSPLNFYFSTIDAGYTVHLEPEGDPDWGHYDSLSMLALGRTFAEYIINNSK
ncbi:MAG: sialate O-acetylesterase [Eubacteriales bacterium]